MNDSGYSISYDELTDTLYLSKGQPQPATSSYLDEDYVIVRKVDDQIQAITIEGFIARQKDGSWNDQLILKYLPAFPMFCRAA